MAADTTGQELRKRGRQQGVSGQKESTIIFSSSFFSQSPLKEKTNEEQSSLPKLVRVPYIPAEGESQRVQYFAHPDGKGGYHVIRHVIWKPTMWFRPSSERPLLTYQTEINVLYWLLLGAAFLLRFWRINFPPLVM